MTNKLYGGWDATVERLIYANGIRDPWRDATVSSDFHRRQSTPLQPILVSDGFHASDLGTKENIDPTVAKVQKTANAYITKWLTEKRVADRKSKPGDDKLVASMNEIIQSYENSLV